MPQPQRAQPGNFVAQLARTSAVKSSNAQNFPNDPGLVDHAEAPAPQRLPASRSILVGSVRLHLATDIILWRGCPVAAPVVLDGLLARGLFVEEIAGVLGRAV